ncbi:MAG: peptidoglycan editing factor PgeF [Bacteroidia bacterium]|nr:peptidoglycan editing factor PgeF [Bacteroidia bacterium]
MDGLLTYNMGPGVEAFSSMRDECLPYHVITGHQVHGTRIAVITDQDTGRDDLDGYDAFITNLRGCAIGVRTADCIPVLLYDPKHNAVAAIHSGWKGTLNRISQKTVFKMTEQFGTDPADLKAVIGPGICRACFQVGEEVVNYFKGNGIDIEPIYLWDGPKQGGMKGGHHLDLIEENRLLLVESGVRPDNVFVSGICTYEDERFYSARREGRECGRIINSIKIL